MRVLKVCLLYVTGFDRKVIQGPRLYLCKTHIGGNASDGVNSFMLESIVYSRTFERMLGVLGNITVCDLLPFTIGHISL